MLCQSNRFAFSCSKFVLRKGISFKGEKTITRPSLANVASSAFACFSEDNSILHSIQVRLFCVAAEIRTGLLKEGSNSLFI